MKNAWKVVDEEVKAYNNNQFEEMYRSTQFVINCLKSTLGQEGGLSVLDVGCSAGANLYHIANYFKDNYFTGIDFNEHYLWQAIEKFNDLGVKNAEFYCKDFKNYDIKHDIVGSSQVLGVMDYDDALEFMQFCFMKARKGAYFFSMFSERDLEFEVYIHDYTFVPKKRVPYCIYSIPKLEELAEKFGYQLKSCNNFLIDIDLPDKHEGRGTYTKKIEAGERLMFTGALYLPWKYLYFEKK